MTAHTTPLPYLTADLPGIGGRLKDQPEDFLVEEIPAYEPCGTGEHLFLWIEKRDLPHDLLLKRVSRTLDIKTDDIGCAGIKDRRAVTRQYLSVPVKRADRIDQLNSDDLKVIRAVQHGNKLRTGHLKGNHFTIVVREVVDNAAARADSITSAIRKVGFPNYYGEQRFGIDGQTLTLGLDLLAGRKSPRDIPYSKRKFLLRLAVSSVQSDLFNEALRERLQDQLLSTVLAGDVMEVVESGGKFVVEDVAREQARLDAHELAVTGPMFGLKMLTPTGVAAEREAKLLDASGLKLSDFAVYAQLLLGARRSYVVYPGELTCVPDEASLCFEFRLPSGCYATTLLREFMKLPEASAEHPSPREDVATATDEAQE